MPNPIGFKEYELFMKTVEKENKIYYNKNNTIEGVFCFDKTGKDLNENAGAASGAYDRVFLRGHGAGRQGQLSDHLYLRPFHAV